MGSKNFSKNESLGFSEGFIETRDSCVERSELEPLISAFIDGELDDETASLVNAHLSGCLTCCQFFDELARIESSLLVETLTSAEVETGAGIEEPNLRDALSRDLPSKPVKHLERPHYRNVLRWVPLAAAASVMVGLGLVALTPSAKLTAEEFVEPATEVHVMHQQGERNQDLIMNAIELDLRAMRRELVLLGADSSADKEKKQKITATIEQLILKVNQLRTPSDSLSNQEQ